jgi:hypothetical protein
MFAYTDASLQKMQKDGIPFSIPILATNYDSRHIAFLPEEYRWTVGEANMQLVHKKNQELIEKYRHVAKGTTLGPVNNTSEHQSLFNLTDTNLQLLIRMLNDFDAN